MKFDNPYFTLSEKLDLLAKWIIVHSILYYEHDTTLASDFMYDANGKQFLSLIKNSTKEDKQKMRWWYVLKHYDGSTGFHLLSKLNKEDRQKIDYIIETLIKDVK